MLKSLKMALGAAVVFGWANAALAGPEGSGSGSGSGSQAQTTPPAAQGDACCASGGCCGGSCCIEPGCEDECKHGGIILDGEWHILRPYVNDNRAFLSTTAAGGAAAAVQNNFNYRYESDPSITFGYRGEGGLGFTATWFHVNNSASTINTAATAGGPVILIPAPAVIVGIPIGFIAPGAIAGLAEPISLNDSLKMDVWDFDVTQTAELGRFDLTLGGGIRYLHMAQSFDAAVTIPAIPGLTAGGTVNDNLSNTFNAGGPTLILNGVRRFGDSGFGLYANSRAGVLFGNKRENGSLTASSPLIAAITFGTPSTTSNTNLTTVGFAELELGVQWGRSMGNVNPFVRIGVEGREYWGIGNATAGVPSLLSNGQNSSPVGLFGFAFTAGIGF
jgi:hypothetical protein